MPDDPAHHLNRSECQADFTYTMTVKAIKIQDTGKGAKSVAEDLEAVLKKASRFDSRIFYQLQGHRRGLASDLLERQRSD
jgi:hypothetical protein